MVGANGTGTTLQAGDVLTGGAGTDTLTVSVSGAAAGATTTTAVNAVSLVGIEKVAVNNFNTLAMTGSTPSVTIDASLFDSSFKTIALSSSSSTATQGDTSITNVKQIVDSEMSNGAGSLTVTYVSNAVVGTADAANLKLSAQTGGTFTSSGIETLKITSNSSDNTVTLASGFKTVNTSGAADLTLGSLPTSITALDASAATGGVTATLSTTATASITGGAGNDSFTAGTNLTTGLVNGGAGTDTLALTADAVVAASADGAKFTNFETLSILQQAAATANRTQDVSLVSGITALNATVQDNANGGAANTTGVTFNRLGASTNALSITDLGTVDTGDLTVNVTATRATDTTADAMTVTLGKAASGSVAAASSGATAASATAGTDVLLNLSFANEETLTINSIGGTNYIGTLTDTSAKVVNISASKALTINSMSSAVMTTLDASASTANVTINGNSTAVASTITGGSGNDSLLGGTKADVISGGAGNDTINGGAGVDNLSGGDGNDTFVVSTATDFQGQATAETIDGGAGNDTLQFTANMTLVATDLAQVKNVETLDFASTGANSVTLSDAYFTNSGSTSLAIKDSEATAAITVDASGLSAANSVSVTANSAASVNESLVGGAGNDTFTFSTSGSATALDANDTVNGGKGTDTLAVTLATNSLTAVTLTNVSNIEQITIKDGGAALNASITEATANFVTTSTATTVGIVDASGMTGGGTFTFDGSAETDSAMSITGGTGADTLTGGSKADTISGGDGADQINGGAGVDNLSGGAGGDLFIVSTLADFVGLASAETVSGGTGNDTLRFSDTATTSVNALDLNAISSVETISFTGTGTASITLADSVYTANGSTTLKITDTDTTAALTVNASALSATNSVAVTANGGGAISDSLVGGSGNDTFTFSTATSATALAAGDTVNGGSGVDTLAVTIATNALTAVTLTNVSNIEKITVSGTAALTGSITLADGNFVNLTGAIVDMSGVTDTAGNITFSGANEAESTLSITGGAGADTITGGQKADTISGGNGADVITGGLGADQLTGGNGADIFSYTLVTESNASNTDSITDFVSGTDKLNITLDYTGINSGITVDATVQTARAGASLIQDNLSGSRGQAVYDTTGSALYVNVNADNLLTTADYKININPAATATLTIASADINFVITGGTGADTITAGGGADTIDGAAGADSITGGAGADSITAGTGADTIVGGTGDDTIILGAAGDVDQVVLAATGTDTITGFTTTADKLVVGTSAALGTTLGGAVAANQAAAATGSVFIQANGTGTAYTTTDIAALLVTTAAANKFTVAASSKYLFIETAGGASKVWLVNNDATATVATSEITLVGTVDATLVIGDLANAVA